MRRSRWGVLCALAVAACGKPGGSDSTFGADSAAGTGGTPAGGAGGRAAAGAGGAGAGSAGSSGTGTAGGTGGASGGAGAGGTAGIGGSSGSAGVAGTGGTGAAGTGAGGTGSAGVGGSGGTGGLGGAAGASGAGGAGPGRPLVFGYLLELERGGTGALAKLDYSAVDYLVHAFVRADETTGDITGVGSFDDYRKAGLAQKVHAAGSKLLFSVGGANDSWGLKAVAASAKLRQDFARKVVKRLNEWGYDGVDIDLEFPWGGDEPAQHAALLREVYTAVKANDPSDLVIFGVSPGYLLSEYRFEDLARSSDYGFYFCYDWKNPANGPIKNPGQRLTMAGGDEIEASCRGALDYIVEHGYPADRLIVGFPFYANGDARWYAAPPNADAAAVHADYMEARVGGGWWTTPTALRRKLGAVLDPDESVLKWHATVAGVGFWEWGYEDPASPALSQTIKTYVRQ